MSTKEQVLYALLEDNRAVSGEKLARKLGISRTAVWKAIGLLRKDGYRILARTNRGYSLAEDSDVITEQEIRRWLTTETLGQSMEIHPSLDSTNLRARDAAEKGAPEGMLVVADSQSGGRGRFGRSFYSPGRTGVYMSLVLRPRAHVKIAGQITSLAAVAVARAIDAVAGTHTGIKWVNDLYLNGHKVAGILCDGKLEVESKRMETVILGIGINVVKMAFPKELENIATSIGNECEISFSRSRLIAEICNQLEQLYPSLSTGEYLAENRSRSIVIGRHVTVIRGSEKYDAKVLDIDEEGRLLVKTPEGVRALDSGEVTLRMEKE